MDRQAKNRTYAIRAKTRIQFKDYQSVLLNLLYGHSIAVFWTRAETAMDNASKREIGVYQPTSTQMLIYQSFGTCYLISLEGGRNDGFTAAEEGNVKHVGGRQEQTGDEDTPAVEFGNYDNSVVSQKAGEEQQIPFRCK